MFKAFWDMEENFETLGDYFLKYNPFALKAKKKKVLYFSTYHDAYLYTLKRIRKRSKNGYFDMVLFVMDEIGMDIDTGVEICEIASKQYDLFKSEFILIDWEQIRYERETLELILKALHLLTDTDYSYEDFDFIWEEFIKWEAKNKTYDTPEKPTKHEEEDCS